MGVRRKILLIDDDQNLLANLRALLKGNGLEVVCVSNRATALAEIVVGGIDGMVVDYRLGAENGLELIERARELVPEIPVVLMSGDLDAWARSFVRARASLRHIEKPFSGAEILEMIAEGLSAAENSDTDTSEEVTG